MNEKDKDALILVIYSLYYITTDLYSPNLFSEKFCEGFNAKFSTKFHSAIRIALGKAIQEPNFPYEELVPIVSERFSNGEIFYYLCEFEKHLNKCK